MSMNVGGAKGGIKADINVTPLVDVMLVLLIIMMLVAPLLQQGVSMRLPVAANTTDKPETQDNTVIAISAHKEFYVNARLINKDELATKVKDIVGDKAEKPVFIRADVDVEYGAVMAAMDQLRQAGIENVGLITDPKKSPGANSGGR